MKRQECTWWVNHLFNIAKVSEWNKGHVEDAKEIETAQQMAIEALQQTTWISVDDMLPDSHSPVLISGKNIHLGVYGVDIARYNGGMWQYDGFTFPDTKVLAWMPLPEPYKEGTDADE